MRTQENRKKVSTVYIVLETMGKATWVKASMNEAGGPCQSGGWWPIDGATMSQNKDEDLRLCTDLGQTYLTDSTIYCTSKSLQNLNKDQKIQQWFTMAKIVGCQKWYEHAGSESLSPLAGDIAEGQKYTHIYVQIDCGIGCLESK